MENRIKTRIKNIGRESTACQKNYINGKCKIGNDVADGDVENGDGREVQPYMKEISGEWRIWGKKKKRKRANDSKRKKD